MVKNDFCPHAPDDTNTVMIVMNSMTDNYRVVKNDFQYVKTLPTYEALTSAMRTTELELKALKADNGYELYSKGKE